MATDRQIILLSKIEDLKRQLHNHSSSLSRAKRYKDLDKMKFEKTCIDDCNERIKKAKEELQGI